MVPSEAPSDPFRRTSTWGLVGTSNRGASRRYPRLVYTISGAVGDVPTFPLGYGLNAAPRACTQFLRHNSWPYFHYISTGVVKILEGVGSGPYDPRSSTLLCVKPPTSASPGPVRPSAPPT